MILRIAVALLVPSLALPAQAGKPAKPAKPDVQAELAALQKDLDKAGADRGMVAALVLAFADRHRPAKGTAVLLSRDKAICVAIGSNGTEKEPTATAVELEPAGKAYNIAVGGKGFDSKTDVGGTGGKVVLKSAAKTGVTILVGGMGGKGADGTDDAHRGKKGGKGGAVEFGTYLREGDIVVAGSGGEGGKPGGDGGDGGDAGPGEEKPKK